MAAQTHIVRITAENFSAFQALIAQVSDDGCDLFPPPPASAIEPFLRAQPAPALLRPAEAPRNLHGQDGAVIGAREARAAGGAVHAALPGLPGDAAQQALYEGFRRAATECVVLDSSAAGEIFAQMAAPTDPHGEQRAIFHRAGEDQPWIITYIFAMPAASYLDALRAHPPVDGHPLLTAERWADGRLSVTRIFMLDGVPYALPLYHILPDGRLEAGRMPEDHYLAEARPLATYRADCAARFGALVAHTRCDQPGWDALDLPARLADAPGRPTIVKFAPEPLRDQAQGLLALDAPAHAALRHNLWDALRPPPSGPRLLPVTAQNVGAVQAALSDFAVNPALAMAALRAVRGMSLPGSPSADGARIFWVPEASGEFLRSAAGQRSVLGHTLAAERTDDGRWLLSVPPRLPPLDDAALAMLVLLEDERGPMACLLQSNGQGGWSHQSFPAGRVAVRALEAGQHHQYLHGTGAAALACRPQ